MVVNAFTKNKLCNINRMTNKIVASYLQSGQQGQLLTQRRVAHLLASHVQLEEHSVANLAFSLCVSLVGCELLISDGDKHVALLVTMVK
jgi:hypothetical protein